MCQNDIVVGSRKLGGLLTELGMDGGRLSYVVVGLGINVNLDLGDLPTVIPTEPERFRSPWTRVGRQVL